MITLTSNNIKLLLLYFQGVDILALGIGIAVHCFAALPELTECFIRHYNVDGDMLEIHLKLILYQDIFKGKQLQRITS
jgi:hypothetical protein